MNQDVTNQLPAEVKKQKLEENKKETESDRGKEIENGVSR